MAATQPKSSQSEFTRQLKKYYTFYTGGFVVFVVLLAIAEQMGLPNRWIGYCSSSSPSCCTRASAS
jgi:hypothetical protein